LNQTTYTHGQEEAALAAHRHRTAENSAPHLLDYLRPGMALLDVGCGEGTITVGLARRVAPGGVVGVDLSEEVLASARVRCPEPNVAFTQGDVYALAYPDETFDAVHLHQVLQHLTDPVAALVEIARVTRPGGVISLREGDYGGSCWYPDSEAWESWRDTYRAVARAGGTNLDAGRRLLTWARQAGLEQVDCSASVLLASAASDEAVRGGDRGPEMSARQFAESWAARMTGAHFAELATANGIIDRDGLEHTARGLRAWGQSPDAWFAMPRGEAIIHRS
jgi:SAM-dependent methyltransferase